MNIKFIVVGAAASDERLGDLKEEVCKIHSNSLFLTDDEFTARASEMLGIADYVLGTGRGLMEAASLGKKMFCPVQNSKFPVGILPSTIERCFDMNFSGRAFFNESEVICSIRDIKDLEGAVYRDWIMDFANDFFIADLIPDKLSKFILDTDAKAVCPQGDTLARYMKVFLFIYSPPFLNREMFRKLLNPVVNFLSFRAFKD